MKLEQNGISIRCITELPVLGGNVLAKLVSFNNLSDRKEHIALLFGPITENAMLLRIHSECLTGDVFGSQRCDCGLQLREAIFDLNRNGGILLYLRQEGRGIGLYSKIDSYALQTQGIDTFAANRALSFEDDERDYGCAVEMLTALNVTAVRLLTNNPDKASQLREKGVNVVEQVSTGRFLNPHNEDYLTAKVLQSNHDIELPQNEATTTNIWGICT